MGTVLTISETRSYPELPKKQREFIDQYCLSGDAVQAYLTSGYTDGPNKKAKAVQLRSRLRTHIAQRAREIHEGVDMAILGMKTCRELAINAESEAVRLSAAKELLARGMPDAPQEVHHHHDHHVRNLPEEEIDRRIARILGDLNGDRAIDVTPQSSTVN